MVSAVLVLALVAISFINVYQASNGPNYGTFFTTKDGFARKDPSKDNVRNIIDKSFHKCSIEKSCCKVAENFRTNKYNIVAVGQELKFEKQDIRIWHKGMKFQFQSQIHI